jgi:hypothetical protein
MAAAALRSCSITQRQLAGLDAAGSTADGAAARLLFLDSELLQLEDPLQRSIMIQGLKVSCDVGGCPLMCGAGVFICANTLMNLGG